MASAYILVPLAMVSLSACQGENRLPEHVLTGATMGTSFNIKLVAPDKNLNFEALEEEIHLRLDAINQVMSTYREDSELSAFNTSRSTDWVDVSAELCEAVERSLIVSRETNGAFDVTVGPLVNLWGFGPGLVAVTPPAQADIDAAMTLTGYAHLSTDCSLPALRKAIPELYVDLSGWAKGYAVDELGRLLDDKGLGNYLAEVGGELRVRGHNSSRHEWAIAIEDPDDNQRAAQSVYNLTDVAVATSGDYRNYFEYDGQRYSHTIDARTGRPVSHNLASVTVVDRSAAFADAMATALLVLGPDAGPDMADELHVAGLFLIRNQDELVVKTSSAFGRMGIE
jgi:thiamine biosynthesis lipoprotein